ncbi:hypothetical protein SLEP1_g57579 [Rubroshorea leprosula]|nr:hypothetical protein SLEP1_g57579 [Rubroshorea leprosula]
MASKGMTASDILEEKQGRVGTQDGREGRGRCHQHQWTSRQPLREGWPRGNWLWGTSMSNLTLDSEEDGGGTVEPLEGKLQGAFNSFIANVNRAVEELQGSFVSNGERHKPHRTSNPCGGMETTGDDDYERPKRKQGCFLCGGPHWTRECPRRDALNAIIRVGVESSHTREVSHMVKFEPGEAENMAQISHNLRTDLWQLVGGIEALDARCLDEGVKGFGGGECHGMRVWGPKSWASWHGATTTGTRVAQGGMVKTQRALPVKASIPRSWRKVADKTRGSMQKQSMATCMGTRVSSLETRVHTRATWVKTLARMGADRLEALAYTGVAKSVHRVGHARSGRSVDTRKIHVAMVSTPLQRTGAVQNSPEAAGCARTIPDKGLDGFVGPSPT